MPLGEHRFRSDVALDATWAPFQSNASSPLLRPSLCVMCCIASNRYITCVCVCVCDVLLIVACCLCDIPDVFFPVCVCQVEFGVFPVSRCIILGLSPPGRVLMCLLHYPVSAPLAALPPCRFCCVVVNWFHGISLSRNFQ